MTFGSMCFALFNGLRRSRPYRRLNFSLFTFHSARSAVGATGATLLGKQCPNIVCFCETCVKSCGFAALTMVNVAGGECFRMTRVVLSCDRSSAFVWLEECSEMAIVLP